MIVSENYPYVQVRLSAREQLELPKKEVMKNEIHCDCGEG